ncbi:TetR family transcriptional regulator [Streptomyces sp. 21So2-11]|uniref:TetR/AcrR family transcriptional regulator n=1 Tax=Streptomyces sp. 21So2-11 TaxID=3144408 RepID=UPI003218F666
MGRNPERRTALVDAAIEVLAQEGARGLTFRAVDTRAAVPVGTASNYFTGRDDLFMQAGARIHVRNTPDPDAVGEEARAAGPTREMLTGLMRALVRRMADDRSGYLALLELRLEATRRPALQRQLNQNVRAAFEESARSYVDARLPGDADTFLVLYLAMTGLMLEHFTLPEMLSDARIDQLVETVVARIVPLE